MKKISINNDQKRERAPKGVEINRPILTRLLPDGREKIEQIAIQENRSTSSLVRILILEGLKHHQSFDKQDNS